MVTSVNSRLVVTGMPRHLLSDRHVRTAKPRAKPYRKADGDGLFLYVPPSGVASWQYRYRLHGKQQTATLGKLADMTLAEARDAAGAARPHIGSPATNTAREEATLRSKSSLQTPVSRTSMQRT